ncbi:unnamed protein product [Pleuronectes platessa]|uniref:Uncharacterized protein n=2 Tax=Pleuronectes platessa TaxID=8262 RepID=A0A9N7Z6B7_PLEPL|nr:unnamed protein product [Pleuronectes platessa]
MMRDSAAPLLQRPGLEDVSEEEDVFAADGSLRIPREPNDYQLPRETEVRAAKEDEGHMTMSRMEAEFVQLNLRKQVSYR